MSDDTDDRTASLMTPAKLAQLQVRPKPAASPAAWLDQMASDAGSGHVRRLLELRQQLEAAIRGRESEFQQLAAACRALDEALGKLDFALTQPRGLLARVTGKGKEAAAAFSAQVDRVVQAGEALANGWRGVQRRQEATSIDRQVLECEAELKALERIMDQGARWLQDMRNQLKARQAEGGGPEVQQQIAQDTARCELLVARLKVLRTACNAVQPALERCKGALARRASVLGAVQQVLEGECKAARERLESLADQAAGGAADEAVDGARRAQRGLKSALEPLGQDCAGVQGQDQAAADELAAMQGPLQAAA
jgi:chromosome segregation ATPase